MNGVAWFSRWQGQKSAYFWQSIFWGQDLQNHWWIAQVGTFLLFYGYANQDWAEGEWIVDPESGEQVWQPAEGGEAMSAEAYAQAAEELDEVEEAVAEVEVVAEAEAIVEAAEQESAEDAESTDPA
jgi:hypothetical protein